MTLTLYPFFFNIFPVDLATSPFESVQINEPFGNNCMMFGFTIKNVFPAPEPPMTNKLLLIIVRLVSVLILTCLLRILFFSLSLSANLLFTIFMFANFAVPYSLPIINFLLLVKYIITAIPYMIRP